MKLSTIVLAAAALSAVYAQEAPATVSPGSGTGEEATPAPSTEAETEGPASTTATPSSPSAPSPTGDGQTANTAAGASPLDGLKQKAYGKEYHMPYVRVVQARVQSDKPEYLKGRFVSKYGNGDLKKGYESAMDSVNTASVEGALLFVQAEGINQNARGSIDRCRRKNNMNYVVLYEMLIAQTNETIAQYSAGWNVPEYGPMIPMDSGRCTPLTGTTFPPECLQYNGVDGQPNVGPFVGAGAKSDDVRAPYPDTYWFSFPHTCPLKVWGEKADADDACRAKSRKGLCDMGKAPDGVECTFTYDILGWVPIDDVVGITSLTDENGNLYGNFTTWCEASSDHVEFAGNDKTGEMDEGLDFWKDPLDSTKNSERAAKVVQIYQEMLSGDFLSSMVEKVDLSHFKDLPNPEDLATANPPCYKTVPSCNSGNGCARKGFSQICFPCSASEGCKTDPSYTFPTLEKASTDLPEDELTSGSKLGGATGATGNISGGKTTKAPSPTTSGASSMFQVAFATVAASVAAILVL